jgi:hypothetical protein
MGKDKEPTLGEKVILAFAQAIRTNPEQVAKQIEENPLNVNLRSVALAVQELELKKLDEEQ